MKVYLKQAKLPFFSPLADVYGAKTCDLPDARTVSGACARAALSQRLCKETIQLSVTEEPRFSGQTGDGDGDGDGRAAGWRWTFSDQQINGSLPAKENTMREPTHETGADWHT